MDINSAKGALHSGGFGGAAPNSAIAAATVKPVRNLIAQFELEYRRDSGAMVSSSAAALTSSLEMLRLKARGGCGARPSKLELAAVEEQEDIPGCAL